MSALRAGILARHHGEVNSQESSDRMNRMDGMILILFVPLILSRSPLFADGEGQARGFGEEQGNG